MNHCNMEDSIIRYEFITLILTVGLVTVADTSQSFPIRGKVYHGVSKLRSNGNERYGLRIQPAQREHTTLPTTLDWKADSGEIIPVIYDDGHCQNGGTGYLGSFCLCPPLFSGRYCEIDLHNDTTCGALSHGEWSYKNCHICKCNNGILLCELFRLKGCRDNHKEPNRGTQKLSRFLWTSLGLVTSIFGSNYSFR